MNITCSILVFAKAPVVGRVKTRLLSMMSPESVVSFYKNLVLHTLKMAIGSGVGSVELWCTPSTDHPFFHQCSEMFQIPLFSQTNGDLGRRMAHAFEESLQKASLVFLIGTDCPSLNPDDLREGKKGLIQGYQAVISPSEDGGYVLMGLRQFHPSLFDGISWGSSSVLNETRKRLKRLGWRWKELPERWDIDRTEDLERLKREGGYDFLYPKKPLEGI